MIAVIQCAARKRVDAGFLQLKDGRRVLFVADPTSAPPRDGWVYARPDDLSDDGTSWRDVLVRYNLSSRGNPLDLRRASDL